MKNIAIVYERELHFGGVETHLLSLFRRSDPGQYRYFIFSPISEWFQEKAAIYGAQACPVAGFGPLTRGVSSALAEGFRSQQIDLVNAHSPTAAIQGRAAARRLGLPSLVTVHQSALRYYGLRPTARARLGRILFVQIDRLQNFTLTAAFIYVSERVYRESLARRQAPAKRCRVIPNGIDLADFQPAGQRECLRQLYGISEEKTIITYTGRLSEEKGMRLLLEAVARLPDRLHEQFCVWLVGNGPLDEELRAWVGQPGLEGLFYFMGFQEKPADYLLASDIFVLPSLYEAMPISTLEALAAGLPCVVSDTGDNSRLVENGRQGFVVHPNQPAALAVALQKLIENPALRQEMGVQARLKAAQFSDLEMAENIQAVYREIFTAPSP